MFLEAPSNSAQNKLTQLSIKAFLAEPLPAGVRQRKVSDGGSLFLVAYPGGKAVWRFKYRLGGRERGYTLGRWPGISLEEARRQREVLRAQVQDGKDPVSARRLRRAAAVQDSDNTFGNAYRLWLQKKQQEWSAIHYKNSKRAFERDVLPALERLPVTEITPKHISGVIETIAKRGAIDTAAKVLQHCNGVFRMAQAKGWCAVNPALPVGEVLPKLRNKGRMPAILNFPGLGEIMRAAEAARLSPAVRLAHRLAAFTVCRMGNIAFAEWAEFDLEAETPIWVIPRQKMKAQDRPHDHKVILCPPIVHDLLAWRGLVGREGYVFPTPTRRGPKNARPISREAVEKAYRETLGLKDKHTPQ